MINICKKTYYVFLISFFSVAFVSCTPTTELVLYAPYKIADCVTDTADHKGFGVRAGKKATYEGQQDAWPSSNRSSSVVYISPDDFKNIFKDTPNILHIAHDECEVLGELENFSDSGFCDYACTLPHYCEFMLGLKDRIDNDKSFRKKTAQVPGFKYSFSWGKTKSGFHDFVGKEVERIKKDQEKEVIRVRERQIQEEEWHRKQEVEVAAELKRQQESVRRLHVDNSHELKGLIRNSELQAQYESGVSERFAARIKAIEQTLKQSGVCSDYSIHASSLSSGDKYAEVFKVTYGTPLDCQLHQELIQTRKTMIELERDYSQSHHVQIIAPVIHYFAAQAKLEQRPSVAFEISDFCHDLTKVVSRGICVLSEFSCATGRGTLKGVKTVLTPEHWQEMATGTLRLGVLFLDAMGQEDARQNAVISAALSQDYGSIAKIEQDYCLHTQAQKEVLNRWTQETYKKLKAMPWQELVENGAEFGVTIILDTIALNAASGFVNTTGRAVINELGNAFERGMLFTEEYAVEVAGYGKLIVEEGPEAATVAADMIKKDAALFKASSQEPVSRQVKNAFDMSRWMDDIVPKIRNVGDDVLDIMEKAGGHTLEKHVGQTNNQLIRRSVKDPIIKSVPTFGKAVTTFTNKRVAVNAVKENLKNNAEKIALWLKNGSSDIKIVDFLHKHPIGTGIFKDKKAPLHGLRRSKLVLKKDSTQKLGFKIVTAFPIAI